MTNTTKSLDFVKAVFGNGIVDQSRTNIAVECPDCGKGSGKKKLSINLENWQCHCWVCGLKSKNLTFVLRKYFNKHILEFYTENFSINTTFQEQNLSDDNLFFKNLILPENFVTLVEQKQSRDPDVRACLNYLKSRALSEEVLWRFRLGTCTQGRFRRRVIFPSFDKTGMLNYYVARAIDEDARPKYLNSPNKKTEIIFNEIDIDWSTPVTLVEGPFDLISAGDNALCLLGSEITKNSKMFNRLITHQTPVYLALDADMEAKSFKIAQFLESYCCEVYIVKLGKFSDVGEMSKSQFEKVKFNAKRFNKQAFLSWKIKALRSGSLI